jgi:hypothetical protein
VLRHARSGPPRRPTVRPVAIVTAATPVGTAAILEHQALVVRGSVAPGPFSPHVPAGVSAAHNGEIEWP